MNPTAKISNIVFIEFNFINLLPKIINIAFRFGFYEYQLTIVHLTSLLFRFYEYLLPITIRFYGYLSTIISISILQISPIITHIAFQFRFHQQKSRRTSQSLYFLLDASCVHSDYLRLSLRTKRKDGSRVTTDNNRRITRVYR